MEFHRLAALRSECAHTPQLDDADADRCSLVLLFYLLPYVAALSSSAMPAWLFPFPLKRTGGAAEAPLL